MLFCFRRMEGKNASLHTSTKDFLLSSEDSILWKANVMP
jgi:hypothetical protein